MQDAFGDIARFYDPLMAHVDYERWHAMALALGELVTPPLVHVDAACGTGTLARGLRRAGWRSMGFDLSPAMLCAGRRQKPRVPTVAADLRAVPLRGASFITCLFDSLNFLLDPGDVRRALKELYGALRPGGLLYFDVVTERMVLDHFAGQQWSEQSGRLHTTWDSRYDRATGVSETRIRVNRGPECVIRERIHPREDLESAMAAAGFEPLGAFDAETLRAPRRRTVRIDFVAWRPGGPAPRRRLNEVLKELRSARV